MQQTHGQIGEHLGCQFRMHIHRGTQSELLRLLHKRKHHVSPLTEFHFRADQLMRFLPLGTVQQSGANRRAAWRQLVDLAHVQIAMQ